MLQLQVKSATLIPYMCCYDKNPIHAATDLNAISVINAISASALQFLAISVSLLFPEMPSAMGPTQQQQ